MVIKKKKKKGARGGCISPQAALALGPLSPPGLGYWRKYHSSVHHHLETEELPSLYTDNKYKKQKKIKNVVTEAHSCPFLWSHVLKKIINKPQVYIMNKSTYNFKSKH